MEEIIREYVSKFGVFGLERYLIGCINGMAKNEILTDEEKLENIKELIDEYGKITGYTEKDPEFKKMLNESDPEFKEMFNKEFKLEMILIGTLYQFAIDKDFINLDKLEAIKKLIADYKEVTGWAEREKDPEFQKMADTLFDILENADDIEVVRTPYKSNESEKSYLN